MSGYRPIYKKIWKDPDFQDLSAEDKLLFIYLCTNEATNESGIYPITPKTISDETNIPYETVKQRLTNGNIKNIDYDVNTRVIFVKNLQKYNTGGKPDLVFKAISKECSSVPHETYWVEFISLYPKYQGIANGLETVCQPSDNDTIKIRYDKEIYGEFQNILLTKAECSKLIERFGDEGFKRRVKQLSTGIESKGYKYKSHYATILNWERMEVGRNGTHKQDFKKVGENEPDDGEVIPREEWDRDTAIE